MKVSHNGQEQTLDTELQIEPTVVSNMVYFDVRHPIKDISGYDEVIRISFSYLNSITGEIINTKYGISYNNTSGILSNSARYNTKISAVTTDKEQTIMGKKTFNDFIFSNAPVVRIFKQTIKNNNPDLFKVEKKEEA